MGASDHRTRRDTRMPMSKSGRSCKIRWVALSREFICTIMDMLSDIRLIILKKAQAMKARVAKLRQKPQASLAALLQLRDCLILSQICERVLDSYGVFGFRHWEMLFENALVQQRPSLIAGTKCRTFDQQ